MGDMTEPAFTPVLLDREAVAQRLLYEEGSEWAEGTDRHYELADAVLELARPMPTREQILSAIIAHVFEEGDTPLVRQGMPQQEWVLLSLAADAASALMRGDQA